MWQVYKIRKSVSTIVHVQSSRVVSVSGNRWWLLSVVCCWHIFLFIPHLTHPPSMTPPPLRCCNDFSASLPGHHCTMGKYPHVKHICLSWLLGSKLKLVLIFTWNPWRILFLQCRQFDWMKLSFLMLRKTKLNHPIWIPQCSVVQWSGDSASGTLFLVWSQLLPVTASNCCTAHYVQSIINTTNNTDT